MKGDMPVRRALDIDIERLRELGEVEAGRYRADGLAIAFLYRYPGDFCVLRDEARCRNDRIAARKFFDRAVIRSGFSRILADLPGGLRNARLTDMLHSAKHETAMDCHLWERPCAICDGQKN